MVGWSDHSHTLPTFDAAKQYLMQALFFLAEDVGDESVFDAWDRVYRWTSEYPAPKEIKAGTPLETYTMVRQEIM